MSDVERLVNNIYQLLFYDESRLEERVEHLAELVRAEPSDVELSKKHLEAVLTYRCYLEFRQSVYEIIKGY